jgi:ankyrin repeat protein
MSDRRILPARPDLRRLRDEAKARRHSGEFPSLALAHLAIAREYGFVSWPRLKLHVDALSLTAAERAEALVRSACSSNLRQARTLLDADPALGRYDLAAACVTGEAAYVAQRLAHAPRLARTAIPPLHREPLLYASFSRLLRGDPQRAPGIREVVRLLLEAGADPNASFDEGDWLQAPLYGSAGIANDVAVTKMLLDAGADPNDGDRRHPVGEALYHACEFADTTCAALLIDAGTNQDVVDYCLGRALNFPDPAMAEMFCAHGARASAGHLHQAVWRRRPVRMVRALLDAGAPLDIRDDEGFTPLQMATRWGDRETVTLLLERGADPALVSDADRELGAFLAGGAGGDGGAGGGEGAGGAGGTAAPSPRVDSLPVLDEMLNHAVQGGHLDAVRHLLDAGARLDGNPESADDPLGQAAWRGYADIVRELVARGARFTFDSGGSALGAAFHGSRHCQNAEGGPTMQAIDEVPQARYTAVVKILLDAGAPVPAELWDGAPSPATFIAELGLELLS